MTTHKLTWTTYVGGCFAASNKHSRMAISDVGSYSIQPISSESNVEMHLGYVVTFFNVHGKLGRSLCHRLTNYPVPLREALKLCLAHYNRHAS